MKEAPNGAYQVVRALLTLRGPDDRDVGSGLITEVLASALDPRDASSWLRLASEADHHGVAPLIEPMISSVASGPSSYVPDTVWRAFVVLASRHRRAALAREECIDRLLVAFDSAQVPVLLLKGAALAHCLYPHPDLRPMSDVDILVDPKDVKVAVSLVKNLRFEFESEYGSRFTGAFHHLPVAKTIQSGFSIALEIHKNTMSPNQFDSLTLASLTADPQPVRRGSGPDGLALGHTDMLRHLCRHAFEPAKWVRLIHLFDLWRYQARFRSEIDWEVLDRRFPHVLVALQLVRYVFEEGHLPPTASKRQFSAPAGVGSGMMPLSEIAASTMSPRTKLDALLNPPDWWLHGFYGVAPGRSLLACRAVRHPATIARWLSRRLWSRAMGSLGPGGESDRFAHRGAAWNTRQ